MFWAGLAALVAFGSAQALSQFGRGLDGDEPFCANVAHLSLAQMWALFHTDTGQPVYYLLLKGWTMLFGESEVALRLPSLLSFAALIVVAALIARHLFGPWAGLVSGFLASISAIGLTFAATVRPYILVGLLVALTTLAAVHLMQLRPNAASASPPQAARKRDLGPWAAVLVLSALGLLTHPIFAFFLAACAVAAVLVSRRAVVYIWTAALAALAIYFGLWGAFFFAAYRSPAIDWMLVPGPKELLAGYLNLWGQTDAIALAAGLGLIALRAWRRAGAFLAGQAGRVLIVLAGLSGLVPFALSQWRPVYIASRTPILFLPTACVLAAGLVDLLKPRWISGVVMLALALGAARGAYLGALSPDPSPARASIAYVVEQARCGDLVITTGLSLSEVSYYFRRLHAPACLQVREFPAEVEVHPGWLDDDSALSRPDTLEAEARALADLAPQPPARTWVFYSSQANGPVTKILKKELDDRLQLSQRLGKPGSFFNLILIYLVH